MKTIRELIHKATENHEATIDALNKLPMDMKIGHSHGRTIFMADATFEECMATLHTMRESLGKYRLMDYWTNMGRLSIGYQFESCPILEFKFMATDLENAVEKISGGKCSIKEQITPAHTEVEVVCNL